MGLEVLIPVITAVGGMGELVRRFFFMPWMEAAREREAMREKQIDRVYSELDQLRCQMNALTQAVIGLRERMGKE